MGTKPSQPVCLLVPFKLVVVDGGQFCATPPASPTPGATWGYLETLLTVAAPEWRPGTQLTDDAQSCPSTTQNHPT